MARRFHPPPEVQAVLAEFFQVEDMRDQELFRKMHQVTHILEHMKDHQSEHRFSASRQSLLVRLAIAHRLGRTEGLQPSELSEHLGVSRNTVSALLKGLEEQGLIERRLHPIDRRQFLINITPAGEAMVREHAPKFAAFVSDILSVLSEEERRLLSGLLDKLLNGMIGKAEKMGMADHCFGPAARPDQE
jgi:DNA-binding MarR family transcriptional regulator